MAWRNFHSAVCIHLEGIVLIERYYRSYVRALWHGFVAWVQRDALYRELAALDARGLKDIGITRADIPAIVEGRFWRGGDGDDMDET